MTGVGSMVIQGDYKEDEGWQKIVQDIDRGNQP
jgi:hypothetical protein